MKVTRTTLVVLALAALGGALYGFDIGVVSGALQFMNRELSLSPNQSSLVVASVLGGGAFATLFSGALADYAGRRRAINIATLIFIVGVVLIVVADSFLTVLAGRLIQGIGIGAITIVVPLYVAETAPARVRGRGLALFQLCLTIGIFAGYVVNFAFAGTRDWRAMFGVALAPAAVFLAGGVFVLPRSPRWLYVHGQVEEAMRVLRQTLGAEAAVAQALDEIRQIVKKRVAGTELSWRLLLDSRYRLPLFIAIAVGILNQLTGINVLMQFNAVILHASGLHAAILASTFVGAAHVAATAVALVLVDRLGRRPLLIVGTLGMAASLGAMGAVLLFTTAGSPAGAYTTLIGTVAFVSFFAVGPGVVVWLVISEILPLAVRAKGMGVALFANSLSSAVLAALFMSVVGAIGYSGLFMFLCGCCILYALMAILVVPETRGLSLERIEQRFAAAWRSPERQQADPAGNRSPHAERPTGATRAKNGEPLAQPQGWAEPLSAPIEKSDR